MRPELRFAVFVACGLVFEHVAGAEAAHPASRRLAATAPDSVASNADACLPPDAARFGIRVVTSGAEPALSRDGKWMAYVRGGGVCVMELATHRSRVILETDNPHSPSFSPDGRRLVYQSGEPLTIWIVGTDGSGLHRLIAPEKVGDQYPSWSPDGASVAWTHGNRLWIADTSGANARSLTSPDPKAWYEVVCDWSADGQTVLYAASAGPSSDYVLRLVERDGTNARPDPTGVHADHAQWSRDGAVICYATSRAISRTEHRTGGPTRRFPRGDSIDGIRLALSPDQSFLLHDCIAEEGEDEIIWVTLR